MSWSVSRSRNWSRFKATVFQWNVSPAVQKRITCAVSHYLVQLLRIIIFSAALRWALATLPQVVGHTMRVTEREREREKKMQESERRTRLVAGGEFLFVLCSTSYWLSGELLYFKRCPTFSTSRGETSGWYTSLPISSSSSSSSLHDQGNFLASCYSTLQQEWIICSHFWYFYSLLCVTQVRVTCFSWLKPFCQFISLFASLFIARTALGQRASSNAQQLCRSDSKANNGMHPHEEYCDYYYECDPVTNEAVLQACPNGLAFAGAKRGITANCDYPHRVACPDGTRVMGQQPIPTENCQWQYGVFPHATSCTRYWHCWNGTSTLQQCPVSLLYNDVIHSCDWPDNVPDCQKHRKHCITFDLMIESLTVLVVFILSNLQRRLERSSCDWKILWSILVVCWWLPSPSTMSSWSRLQCKCIKMWISSNSSRLRATADHTSDRGRHCFWRWITCLTCTWFIAVKCPRSASSTVSTIVDSITAPRTSSSAFQTISGRGTTCWLEWCFPSPKTAWDGERQKDERQKYSRDQVKRQPATGFIIIIQAQTNTHWHKYI